jgi:hypothetical protein
LLQRAAVTAAALAGALAVDAAEPAAQPSDSHGGTEEGAAAPLPFEVTPYLGYRFGGSFTTADTGQHVDLDSHTSFALALDLRADEGSQYELFYSRQSTAMRGPALASTGVDIEYLHIGGTLLLEDLQRVQSYLLGGLGATRFRPGITGAGDATYFSAALGLGLRVPFNRHFSLRLEARGFWTLVNANTAIFCKSDQTGGVCSIHARGSSFLQGELLAGAAFAF